MQRPFSDWINHLSAMLAKGRNGGTMPGIEVGTCFDSDHPAKGWRVYQKILDGTGMALLMTPSEARQTADNYDRCQIRDEQVDWMAAALRENADEAEHKNKAGEVPCAS